MDKTTSLSLARKLVSRAKAMAEAYKAEGHLKAAESNSEEVVSAIRKGIPCRDSRAKRLFRGILPDYEANEAKEHFEVAKKAMSGDQRARKY